jgi:transcriptional regulator with XRE-family HTH domain
MKEQLSQTLKAARKHKGLTQVQLAVLAHMSPATISQIENGDLTSPRIETLNKLSKVLGIQFHVGAAA